MSIFKLENFPPTTVLREQAIQWAQQKRDEEAEKKQKRENIYRCFASLFKQNLKLCLTEAYKKLREENISSVDFFLESETLEVEDQHYYSLEILHNRISNDGRFLREKNGKPISPIFENLFKDAQEILSQKGYYLLYDVNQQSGFSCFTLSTEKPPGYDQEQPLWHGFNKLPRDLNVTTSSSGTFPEIPDVFLG